MTRGAAVQLYTVRLELLLRNPSCLKSSTIWNHITIIEIKHDRKNYKIKYQLSISFIISALGLLVWILEPSTSERTIHWDLGSRHRHIRILGWHWRRSSWWTCWWASSWRSAWWIPKPPPSRAAATLVSPRLAWLHLLVHFTHFTLHELSLRHHSFPLELGASEGWLSWLTHQTTSTFGLKPCHST